MPIYDPEGVYIAYAIGKDIDAFRNTDALLTVTEIQATDLIDGMQSIAVDFTDPETEEGGTMSSSQYRTRRFTGYRAGRVVLPMFLQSGVGLYSVLGGCTSTDAVAEVTTVECTTKTLSPDLTTFHFWVSSGAGATTEFYIWLDENAGADPADPTGTTLRANINAVESAIDVAGVIAGVINGQAGVSAANSGTATVTITNDNAGGVPDCCNHVGTPTGYAITITAQGSTTHAITLASSQTPIRLAFHFEKEMDSENVRYDFLGHMPDYWKVYCSEDNMPAKQELGANFAYSKHTATDLAEPIKCAMSKLEWSDLKHASGVFTIKYAGTELEFDKRSLDLTVTRTRPLWGVKGASGYPTAAFISGVNIELLVEGYLTGNNVRSLMRTKPEDYTGAYLDVEILFYKATNREFGISLGNLYLIPDQTILSDVDWYEKKTLRFVPWKDSTTISSSVEDEYNKTFYENP